MSSEIAISAKGISKRYEVYAEPYQRLLQMFTSRVGKNLFKEFWALRDVTFDIPKGQVFGILGKNGAGKSTLLQIICGTLSPTTGTVEVNGRIAALLELGSGFNPEFTGIENIYMNAQLLGLSRKEVDRKLEDILSFADIGDFVKQPVKTYSSGMFARLAFSVAVHVEPDILIVDEALSVGDAWFQHKSMAKMRRLMESGCTVLFVSHSIDAVRALCDRAIWIDGGRVKMQGAVTDVTNAYMNDVFIEQNRIALESEPARLLPEAAAAASNSVPALEQLPWRDPAEFDWSGDTRALIARIASVRVLNSRGLETNRIEQDEEFCIETSLQFFQAIENVSIGFLIKDQFGQDLTGESIFNTRRRGIDVAADSVVQVRFRSRMALRGGQSYAIAVRVNRVTRWDRADNVTILADELAAVFEVLTSTDAPMWFKFKLPFEVEYR